MAAYADVQIQTSQVSKSAPAAADAQINTAGGDALFEAVRRGLKTEARAAADAALTMREPLDVVNTSLIPALDAVGDGFEKGTVFLPQLLQAATAAQAAFEAIKAKIAASGQAQGSKGKIVIATVKGDVHDIGKNIVRVILENYGYDVLDLGRDVPPERVVEAVRQTGAAGRPFGPDDHHRAQHAGHHRGPARCQAGLQSHGRRRGADSQLRQGHWCRLLQGRQGQRRPCQAAFGLSPWDNKIPLAFILKILYNTKSGQG